jgi:hypothetical protein
VPGDGDELQPGAARLALRLPPLAAVDQDARDVGERLDVVDERRLPEEAVRTGEGRLVPRLAAPVFQRFEQCGFLAEDLPAG